MPLSDWIIGSEVTIPETTLTITVGATPEDHEIPAGSYYLWDSSSGRSLIDTIATTINMHSLISDAEAGIQENRLVRIWSDTTSFSVVFGSSQARVMAGFASDLTPTSLTHTAQNVSSYLWVPMRLSSKDKARLGTQGNPVFDTAVGMSADGNTTATRHNEQLINDKTWRYIPTDRIHTATEGGGELISFFRNVLSKFHKFKIYNSLQNDEASSTVLTFGGPFGPYQWRKGSGKHEFNWKREIKNVEKYGTFPLPLVSTAEYT